MQNAEYGLGEGGEVFILHLHRPMHTNTRPVLIFDR